MYSFNWCAVLVHSCYFVITYSIQPNTLYETAGIHVLMEATSKNIPEPDTSMSSESWSEPCSEYINHNKYLLTVSVTMLEKYNLFTSPISIGESRCSMYGR